jgi:hypothetical protein
MTTCSLAVPYQRLGRIKYFHLLGKKYMFFAIIRVSKAVQQQEGVYKR